MARHLCAADLPATMRGMTQKQRWTMVAVVLGSSIVFLDGTVVNVALPKIGRELPATLIGVLEGQTYVNSGYLATLSALLILSGALNDFFGRRRMFVVGLVGFGVTSALCGLSPNLELLVVFRILQGAAGAVLVPGSLSIITATFEGPARARAFGIWAAATSATTTMGPIVGGFLVDTLSWRIAFLINVPLVVLGVYATIAHMAETRDDQASGHFDWLGAVVIAVAVGGLAFGAIHGQETQWAEGSAFIALGIGTVALIAFPFLMATRPNPLVPLSLFRSRAFAIINLSTFLIYGALYVGFGFQALFLQNVLGYTAFAAGIAGLPVGICLTFLSTRVGTLAGRLGSRIFLTVGPILMAIASLWLARVPSTSSPWLAQADKPSSLVPSTGYLIDFLPYTLLFGVGIACVVAPLTSTLMGSIPTRNAGLGSAINNAISRVGQPLLGAVIFIAISATFYSGLAARAPGVDTSSPVVRHDLPPLNQPVVSVPPNVVEASKEASTDAFHLALLLNAALLLAGAAVNAVGIRDARQSTASSPTGEPAPSGEEPTTADEAPSGEAPSGL
jgi:EmrB/QacA subfamily drug resistance transporter